MDIDLDNRTAHLVLNNTDCGTVKIGDGNLNVRKGPDATSALVKTVTKDTTLYIYRLESSNTWGRISTNANEWVELTYVKLAEVFGGGSQLPALSENDPPVKELQEVGTVTAKATAIVRKDHIVTADSVGTLPGGTKINFYKNDDADKPYYKNSKDVPIWGYIDADEALSLIHI